jgi:hypothetical protein
VVLVAALSGRVGWSGRRPQLRVSISVAVIWYSAGPYAAHFCAYVSLEEDALMDKSTMNATGPWRTDEPPKNKPFLGMNRIGKVRILVQVNGEFVNPDTNLIFARPIKWAKINVDQPKA